MGKGVQRYSFLRLNGLLELLRVFNFNAGDFKTDDELLSRDGKIDVDTKIENKGLHLPLKENLEKSANNSQRMIFKTLSLKAVEEYKILYTIAKRFCFLFF